MAHKVVLFLLPFVLLFIINDHRSFARDMKIQQENEKQADQPYFDGWLKDSQAKSTSNANPAYLDGWLKDGQKAKSTPNGNQAYLDGWLKDNQAEKAKSTSNSNQVYLDGWLKDGQKEKSNSNQAYLDGWLKDSQEKSNPNSNQVYLDGWLKDIQAKLTTNSNQVYLDGWLKDAYLDGWLKDSQAKKTKSTPNSNQVYLDGWLKDNHDKSNPNFNHVYLDGWLKDNQAKSTANSNSVYLDGWLKDGQKVISTPNSNQAYLDGWLKDSQDEKAKSTADSKQVYLDGWLKDNKDQNEKTIKQAYLDGWLKDSQVDKSKATHISTQAYLDGLLKNAHAKPNDKLSSKVDHTEAFKMAFFAIEDMYAGNVMTLSFPIREYANFLPKKVADSIPLSKSQVPSLLQLFKLTKNSPQGEDMQDIIDQCESPLQKGETKACPTSMESMVEFVHSVIGADAKYNILTTQYPTTSGAALQNYTILEVSKDIYAPKWVACHPRPYPYALYYCHYLDIGSRIFKVLLKGQYGDIMDALAICHLDTSDMPPNHIIFKYLGMKPGEGPLCHFFPVKHIVWVPLPSEASN
ncbi:BURP domain-containing protein 9-like [Trifolium pratense]|uniref:BURP domain-containing protein 9-like n=1 Tax=Trifolium pratense TaxID=57577 RepID=UPI001E693E0F|nr:BURP domain-containing protein 9-like [Trifolium pratense]